MNSRLLMLLTVAALASYPHAASAQDGQQADPAEDPTLARMPELRQVVQADVPAGTKFPAPEVEVVLEIDVDETGKTTRVALSQGAGEPFDGAALAAARRFEWQPAALTTGETVPVSVTFKMRIQEPPPPPPAPAQLGGELFERGTRRPLSGVEVVARVEGKAVARTVTDDQGRFSFEVPAAAVRLVAVPAGHARLDLQVQLLPGESREERYYLEAAPTGYETVVTAEPVRREVTRQVIQRDTVARLAGTQGDTLKVVQNLPGVGRSSFGGGQLILRGAAPGDSVVYLEGQEIPLLYHFGGLRSTFNAAFLESVEFVPGNFGADYGRAIGGVVDVRVRDPAKDLFRGQVDLNFYDAGLHLEGPLSKSWSVGAAFHRSWIDSLLPFVLPKDAPLTFNAAPRYYDYQLLATWQPDSKQRLRITFFGAMDQVAILFDRPGDDPQLRGALEARVYSHSLQVAYRRELASWLSQETSLQLGLQQIDTQIGPDAFFNLGVQRVALRSTWTADPLPWLGVRAGLDWRYNVGNIALNVSQGRQEGEPPVPGSTQQRFATDEPFKVYEPAVFAEVRLKPLDSVLLLPSVRVDYFQPIKRWSVDPRLAARWQVLPGTAVAAGVGLYQQPPTPAESAESTGTPDLLPERSVHASLTVEQRVVEGVDVTATGFYKHLDNQVVRNPLRATDGTQPYYTNDGTGRIFGAELQVKAKLGASFQGWIAYTFQRSFRTDGLEREERLFDFDQPHILTAVGTYTLGAGWSVGARFRLVSGNPATPVVGSVYDAASDTFVPRYGEVNSERLPLFHQLDLRVDKSFTFKTWQLGVYLDVQNVYNQGNSEGWTYNFDYSQRQPITGLPILPILGLKGEW